MLASKIPSLIFRRLCPEGSVRMVLTGPLKGARFVVQSSMAGSYMFGGKGCNFDFFTSKIKSGQSVLDIGGNCGQMALLFSRLVGPQGRVTTFEPVPRNCEVLRKNMELNACSNVKVCQQAVGRENKILQFNYADAAHTQGSLVGFSAGGFQFEKTISVECVSLDAYLAKVGGPAPDVLKIDVEGAGGEVLAGMQNLLKMSSPGIYFEMHSTTRECPEFHAVCELMHTNGYVLETLEGKRISEPAPGWGTPIWCHRAT